MPGSHESARLRAARETLFDIPISCIGLDQGQDFPELNGHAGANLTRLDARDVNALRSKGAVPFGAH
jgi:hypothetical protein